MRRIEAINATVGMSHAGIEITKVTVDTDFFTTVNIEWSDGEVDDLWPTTHLWIED